VELYFHSRNTPSWRCAQLKHKRTALGHTPSATRHFLHNAFSDSLIEPVSYVPDLNPYDYFLWGYLKDTVFQKSQHSPGTENCQSQAESISVAILTKVLCCFIVCLREVRELRRRHTEHDFV
jgi:hypothetical protein